MHPRPAPSSRGIRQGAGTTRLAPGGLLTIAGRALTGRGLAAAAVLVAAGTAWPTAAVAQADTDIHVYSIDRRDGRIMVTGGPRAVTDRAGYDNQPHFTPDGQLLYTSIRGGQADTYRYNPATGQNTRVTATPESEYSPTPIPGSDRFGVVRVEADSAQRLWSFAADGTRPRLVLEDVEPVGYHAWSADRVGVYVLGDPPTLRLADPATEGVRLVAQNIGRSLQSVPERPAMSFTQDLGSGWVIRELRVADGRVRSLAPLLAPDEYHAWTPDGELLTAHGTEVFQLNAATDDWRPVVDVSRHGLGTVTRLAVSPDGGTLAVVVDRPVDPGPVEGDAGSLGAFASLVIGSLLAMVNPLGALTIFVGLTAAYSARHRRFTALWACVTAAAILLVFALFGTAILRFFGITTHAFRIAGGILFFGIGWDMLQAKRSRSKTTPEEEAESADRTEVAVVPLGIPTLAGPGAITTVIALMGQTETVAAAGVVYGGIAVVLLLSFLVLLAGPYILKLMGQTGINVFTRLMGLLVMVIGVQFVLDGLSTVVEGLLGG
ncbi:MAG: MarC family protein [Longimicrobiales bacterium]